MITVNGEDDDIICPQKFKVNGGYSFSPVDGYFGQVKFDNSAEDDDAAGREGEHNPNDLLNDEIDTLGDARGALHEMNDKVAGAIAPKTGKSVYIMFKTG